MLSNPPFERSIRPIFIIGAPRSGTSITNWAVGQLANVQTMEETSWIASMAVGAWRSFGYGSVNGRYSHLSNVAYDASVFMRRIGEAVDAIVQDCYEERCFRLYGDYHANGELRPKPEYETLPFQVRRSVDEPKRRWIDGTPFNTYFTWALMQMFPEAQFIHNLRRPQDVATSLEGFDNIGQEALQLAEGLRVWYNHTEHAHFAEQALGRDRVFRLDFERLASDKEALFREVADFLGEPWSAECLAPLASRINSSAVDDRREGNLQRLAELPEYEACERLYGQVVSRPPSNDLDTAAWERLRERFVEFASHHPLL